VGKERRSTIMTRITIRRYETWPVEAFSDLRAAWTWDGLNADVDGVIGMYGDRFNLQAHEFFAYGPGVLERESGLIIMADEGIVFQTQINDVNSAAVRAATTQAMFRFLRREYRRIVVYDDNLINWGDNGYVMLPGSDTCWCRGYDSRTEAITRLQTEGLAFPVSRPHRKLAR
jgi:hypothetical protein